MECKRQRRIKPDNDFLPLRHEYIMLFAMMVIAFWAYSTTFGHPFVFDDKSNILNNPSIRISDITIYDLYKAAFQSPSGARPIVNVSFAFNYYFHGYDVIGYRIVNILIHLINGLLLYYLTKVTLSLPGARKGIVASRWVPFYTALLWIVHPLHVQSVTYIVQRMNSMAAMFYILSILLYAKGRLSCDQKMARILFTASIFSGIMAIGSKQIAATLPIMVIIYEFYFFKQLERGWLKVNFRRCVILISIFSAMTFLYLGLEPLERILAAYDIRDFTMGQRILTEFRVVIFYLSLIFLPYPSRLSLDHNFMISSSLIDPASTIFSLAMILGLIAFAIFIAKEFPLISFCIIWFFGNLIIESSFIGLEIIFEHRTYLPSMFLMLGVVLGVEKIIRWETFRFITIAFLASLLVFYTSERNTVWATRVKLWADCVKKAPKKARPYHNLGLALEDDNRLFEAEHYYRLALAIEPDHIEAANNLGLLLASVGKENEAESIFRKALRIAPHASVLHYNLGKIMMDFKSKADAKIQYCKAIQIDSFNSLAHYNLGLLLVQQKDFAEAMYHYAKAVQLSPEYVNAHINLANLLVRMGKLNEAIDHFRKSVVYSHGDRISKGNFQMALRIKKELDIAVSSLEKELDKITNSSALDDQTLRQLQERSDNLDSVVMSYRKRVGAPPELFKIENYYPVLEIKRAYQKVLSSMESREKDRDTN